MTNAFVGALGALAGPLHGGAPSRVLDMLDAIGDPASAAGVGTQPSSTPAASSWDSGMRSTERQTPRSETLKQVALGLGGELVERAVAIEVELLPLLAEHRPGAAIVTNVEYYAAVVLHLAGLPQEAFTLHLRGQPHRRLGCPHQ